MNQPGKEAGRSKSWKQWESPMTEPYSVKTDGFVSEALIKFKLE